MSPSEFTRFGYARVSTTDQDLTLQREALKAADCTLIREERASGTTTDWRSELTQLLEFIRKVQAEGVPTVSGRGRWTAAAVSRLRSRLAACTPSRDPCVTRSISDHPQAGAAPVALA